MKSFHYIKFSGHLSYSIGCGFLRSQALLATDSNLRNPELGRAKSSTWRAGCDFVKWLDCEAETPNSDVKQMSTGTECY